MMNRLQKALRTKIETIHWRVEDAVFTRKVCKQEKKNVNGKPASKGINKKFKTLAPFIGVLRALFLQEKFARKKTKF